MRIDMTRADIVAAGSRSDYANLGRSCPVWQAINRISEGALSHWWVGRYDVGPWPVKEAERIMLPAEVRQWIHDFDHGEKMKPISFELEIDEQR